jgi:hypothetical protein
MFDNTGIPTEDEHLQSFWCIDLNSCISLNYNIACQHLEDAYTNTKIALAYVPKTSVAGEVVGHYLSKLLKIYS